MDIPRNHITAFIGPSGCGKSTLLRCLNRLNDLVEGVQVEGTVTLDGTLDVQLFGGFTGSNGDQFDIISSKISPLSSSLSLSRD